MNPAVLRKIYKLDVAAWRIERLWKHFTPAEIQALARASASQYEGRNLAPDELRVWAKFENLGGPGLVEEYTRLWYPQQAA